MKKKPLVLALIGVGLVVGAVAIAKGSKAASAEGRACLKLGAQCGGQATSDDFDTCVDGFKKARKVAGDAGVDRSLKCIDESASCVASAGCMVGGVGVGAIGQFIKGFGSALP